MIIRWVFISFIVFVLAACAPVGGYRDSDSKAERNNGRFEPVTVRVSGYGTYAQSAGESSGTRQRLMARRASRLDAYRNLAERVYGAVVYGSSTVNDFVLGNDAYRAYVDSYIRGAKTVAVNEHNDGVVETVMELKLEPRFRECVARVSADEVQNLCPIPMPLESDRVGDVESRSAGSLYYLD